MGVNRSSSPRGVMAGVLRRFSPRAWARNVGLPELFMFVAMMGITLILATNDSARSMYRSVTNGAQHQHSGDGPTRTQPEYTPPSQPGRWKTAPTGAPPVLEPTPPAGHPAVDDPLVNTTQPFKYSIKPMAYVFPQFHAIPENDKFWGEGFTEWTMVKKAEKNRWGIDVLKPAPEVGYYNLLDLDVRRRQGKWIKEIGVHGIVYHHYWFGRPVMDGVLQALLRDNEPNVPFMLSWANEPWTKRWDGRKGAAGEMLLAQNYGGIKEWREHFDYLLQYFRHPLYMRSADGKRVQFVVYNLMDIGVILPRMFAAWHAWAVEEGLGALEIIETRIDIDPWNRGNVPDSMLEFAPRARGNLDHTSWPTMDRRSRVYHRGICVGWDNTPRHISDGAASGVPLNHFRPWKRSVVRMLERIKSDPNPVGEDNYLMINALNEWGEGNVLEQSVQWGDAFGRALKEALDEAEERFPWRHEVVDQGLKVANEIAAEAAAGATSAASAASATTRADSPVDVCVLIPVHHVDGRFTQPLALQLPELMRSLQEQTNGRWRAIAFPAYKKTDNAHIIAHVLDTHDPRISWLPEEPAMPEDVLAVEDDDGPWAAADWVLSNLAALNTSCELAGHFLVANPASVLAPTVFDHVAKGKAKTDIVGLNFVSAQTTAAAEAHVNWDGRCTRIYNETAQFCVPSTPKSPILDLGAVLVSLPKFVSEGHTIAKMAASLVSAPGAANATATQGLRGLVSTGGWSWSNPAPAPVKTAEDGEFEAPRCEVVYEGTYQHCTRVGFFWLDSPKSTVKDGKFASGCASHYTMQANFGMDLKYFDIPHFMESGLCIRPNKEATRRILAGEI